MVRRNWDDIDEMSGGSSNVLITVLKLVDKYHLYSQVAFPKHHNQSYVPEIYCLAGKTKGVFINPAFIEPFGLTLIEAAAHGLLMVAIKNGGPVDIHQEKLIFGRRVLIYGEHPNAAADDVSEIGFGGGLMKLMMGRRLLFSLWSNERAHHRNRPSAWCIWSMELLGMVMSWLQVQSWPVTMYQWRRWLLYAFKRWRGKEQVIRADVVGTIYSIWRKRNSRYFDKVERRPAEVF